MTSTRFVFVFGSLLAVGATGCGDDDDGGGATCGDNTMLVNGVCVGDEQVDAAVGPTCGAGTTNVGGMCIPTPDPTPFAGFDANEGGEVRMEYMKFPNGGIGVRTMAFIFQDPGSVDFYQYVNLNGCTVTGPGANLKTNWPVAQNPVGERDYYDVGSYIAITGGPTTYQVNKNTTGTPARDPFFRDHPATKWYFDPATNADSDGNTFITPATTYDVTFPGSSEFPGVSYDNAIYVPADFALIDPPHTGTKVFPADTAQTFTFSVPTNTPPAGTIIRDLIAFTGANGPVAVCLEPSDGSLTVPADIMNVVRTAYPTGGVFARQTIAHQVRELVDSTGPTGRRIDFMGVWCYSGAPFTAQ